jgi:cbb3-type cytochrome oxidase cytochrome c subunit
MALTRRLRILTVLIAAVAGVFAVMQLIRPSLENPPVTAEIQAPEDVKAVLRGSCYNCHSNETKLAWFDEFAPPYWLVAHDVTEARRHLNFSEIAKLPAAQQRAFLFEAVNMIQLGAMPLPAYLKAHPGAAVTPEQLAVLRNYLSAPPDVAQVAAAAAKAPADASAADAEYSKWVTNSEPTSNVQPEFNGVAFMPDYKNWKAISSTDRWDNHTMREILGNDVAIKAIAEHNINPWPDGAAFAKVAWQQGAADDKGLVKTGAFYQVELMIKDAKKYAATEGWGWGRWRGDGLKPYGKDADFQSECTTCHAPMRANDYVYTMPISGQAGGQQ